MRQSDMDIFLESIARSNHGSDFKRALLHFLTGNDLPLREFYSLCADCGQHDRNLVRWNDHPKGDLVCGECAEARHDFMLGIGDDPEAKELDRRIRIERDHAHTAAQENCAETAGFGFFALPEPDIKF